MTDWLTPDELGRIEGVLEQTIPNEATRIIVSLMAHAAEADRRIEALSAQVAALENERSDLRLARDQWKSAAHEWVAARDLRDDVIRELADAGNAMLDALANRDGISAERMERALARVDALNEPMTGRRCGDDDCDGRCCARVDTLGKEGCVTKTICMNMYWISPSVGKHCQKFAGHDGKCGKKDA